MRKSRLVLGCTNTSLRSQKLSELVSEYCEKQRMTWCSNAMQDEMLLSGWSKERLNAALVQGIVHLLRYERGEKLQISGGAFAEARSRSEWMALLGPGTLAKAGGKRSSPGSVVRSDKG
jgi:hypothetical protein